jgi:hypothetical protein
MGDADGDAEDGQGSERPDDQRHVGHLWATVATVRATVVRTVVRTMVKTMVRTMVREIREVACHRQAAELTLFLASMSSWACSAGLFSPFKTASSDSLVSGRSRARPCGRKEKDKEKKRKGSKEGKKAVSPGLMAAAARQQTDGP